MEKRGPLSVAEKLRTWFTQLFTYATLAIPNMGENPSKDLEVVALPLPPVEHNPFLRMPELPSMMQTLRKYPGCLNTQLGLRLLMLTESPRGDSGVVPITGSRGPQGVSPSSVPSGPKADCSCALRTLSSSFPSPKRISRTVDGSTSTWPPGHHRFVSTTR